MLGAWGRPVQLIERLSGANRNETWAVRLGGRRYAARAGKRPVAALEWEIRLLDHLRAAGMLVPTALPTPDGRRHVRGVVMFTWLEGHPPAGEGDWWQVAAELRRLHNLTSTWPQRPGFRSTRELLVEARGGDVRLDRMPEEAVARIRAAWQDIAEEPQSVVHGDPGAGNVVIHNGQAGLVDWDEARIDASILDLADLPLDLTDEIGAERLTRARRAANAWEAANAWFLEPGYARRRLQGV